MGLFVKLLRRCVFCATLVGSVGVFPFYLFRQWGGFMFLVVEQHRKKCRENKFFLPLLPLYYLWHYNFYRGRGETAKKYFLQVHPLFFLGQVRQKVVSILRVWNKYMRIKKWTGQLQYSFILLSLMILLGHWLWKSMEELLLQKIYNIASLLSKRNKRTSCPTNC